MPPSSIQRIIWPPARNICSISLTSVVFICISRSEFSLGIESRECADVSYPATDQKHQRVLRLQRRLNQTYARPSPQRSVPYGHEDWLVGGDEPELTAESTSYTRKPELKLVRGVTEGPICKAWPPFVLYRLRKRVITNPRDCYSCIRRKVSGVVCIEYLQETSFWKFLSTMRDTNAQLILVSAGSSISCKSNR